MSTQVVRPHTLKKVHSAAQKWTYPHMIDELIKGMFTEGAEEGIKR